MTDKKWELVDILKQIVEVKMNQEKELMTQSRMYRMNDEGYKQIAEKLTKVFYDTLKKYIKIKISPNIENRHIGVRVLIEF